MLQALQRFVMDPVLAGLMFVFAWAFALAFARCLQWFVEHRAAAAATGFVPAGHKLDSLQSLRGLLALAVVAHHACCWFHFTQTGMWTTGGSIVFDRLASFGVVQFFYLSGFLFWRKLIKAGAVPLGRFYLSRFVRIAPVYFACIGAAVLLGLAQDNFRLEVPVPSFLFSVLPWILFSLGGQPSVNHADIARVTAGVSWTLALEWLFYLALPFFAWFARRAYRLIYLAVFFAGLHVLAVRIQLPVFHAQGPMNSPSLILSTFAKFMLIGFGGGMVVAAFEPQICSVGLARWRNGLLLGLYLAYLLIPGISGPGQILLLAAFALVVQGADLFGLLHNRAVRLLGDISYPVYLVHGIVFYAAMRLRGGIHIMASSVYIAETAACLGVIFLLAAATHFLLERPTMRLSERLARHAALPPVTASG